MLFRRFISRLLAFRASTDVELLDYLQPLQLSVGVGGGCDAIIHATRLLADRLQQEDLVIIRVDAPNAFNNVERQLILREIISRCPGLDR